jgi:hypothetical protein
MPLSQHLLHAKSLARSPRRGASGNRDEARQCSDDCARNHARHPELKRSRPSCRRIHTKTHDESDNDANSAEDSETDAGAHANWFGAPQLLDVHQLIVTVVESAKLAEIRERSARFVQGHARVSCSVTLTGV